ncbi:MAG: thiamine pyrophosphate-binding protein [Alphaproteobacteria bacterium]
MPQPLRNADLIARRLAAAGCRHAFGIPGGEVLTLCDALAAAGLRVVLVKHENAGGFIGEGVQHMTGAPAVLFATLGPGVANAVNVVANAWQDRVPMLFLTGCVDPADAATYTHQVFDHSALLRPITKASLTAVDGAVGAIVDKAIAIATDGQPGPVHLDVPIGVAQAAAGPEPAPRPAPAAVGPAPGAALEQARAWFRDSRRPLLIAGVDALNDGSAAAVAGFARRHAVPLITTYKAKGMLDEADPLALGGAGLSPKADALLLPFVADSDLIVLAGYDPIEMRAGWRAPFPADARIVEFAAVPNTHGMHRAGIAFACNVAAGLEALAAAGGRADASVRPDAAPLRRKLADAFAVPQRWGPHQVFATARASLPADTVATADSGAHRILLSQMWRCPAPRTLLQSSALCTMGCAVPLAIGAKLAAPDRPAVAFVGDAGLEMVLGELATARDLKLPVIVIVLADRSLAMIALKQRRSGFADLAVDFGATDFAAVAGALGGHGARVADAGALAREIDAALGRRDRFTVIACDIDGRDYDDAF